MNSFSCRNVGNNINVYMTLTTFFCMLIINAQSTLISWNISTTSLPKKIYNHACGYDAATKNIFLHSGWVNSGYTLNAYSYNVDTHDTKSFNSFTGAKQTDFFSPAYTNSPYWYFFRNNKFGQFIPDTISPSLQHPLWSTESLWPTSIESITTYACIVISFDGDYLIVTGGYSGNPTTKSIKTVQIYNKISEIWSYGTQMDTARDSHGCIVSNNNILYAIGGYEAPSPPGTLDTIETIDISDINNLPASWDMNTNTGYKLKSKKHKINCVLYENNIYVIGGEKMNLNYVSEVDIIDTTTKLVTAGPLLPVSNGIAGSCSVIVNDRIYVLGGYNAQEYEGTNTIIISNSLQPTVSPTTTAPTTSNPTTGSPTTTIPTTNPPTSIPTTVIPTTSNPTTSVPTTLIPTTDNPTTNVPTTVIPTTNMPTTHIPTTDNPTTNIPTTSV
eukprot:232775_1